MGFNIGNEYIGNIPEMISKLIKEVEELKSHEINASIIYTGYDGTSVLADVDFSKIKLGDFIQISSGIYTVVDKTTSPNRIYGTRLDTFDETHIYMHKLVWFVNGTPTITYKRFTIS